MLKHPSFQQPAIIISRYGGAGGGTVMDPEEKGFCRDVLVTRAVAFHRAGTTASLW